jgi:hypothetical protein
MRGVRRHRWWLMALVLAGCIPLVAAHAKPAAEKPQTLVGNISGSPMGTWMTLIGSGTPPVSNQINLARAKITEKGKSLKRYKLADGWKVRVKGIRRGIVIVADTVEVLERSKPKKPH